MGRAMGLCLRCGMPLSVTGQVSDTGALLRPPVSGRPGSPAVPWLLLVGADLAYRVLMAAYWVLLTRLVARSAVGLIALANALAVPVLVVCDAGFSQYLVREYRVGQRGGLPTSLRWPVRRRQLGALIASVLVSLGCRVLGSGESAALVGLLIGASYSFDLLGQISLAGPRANLTMIPDVVVRLVQSGGVLVTLLVLRATVRVTAVEVALVSTLVYAVAYLFTVRAASQVPRWRELDGSVGTASPGVESAWSLNTGRGAFACAAIAIAIYSGVDAVAVQWYFGPAMLASYAVAFKLIDAARIAPGAIARVVLASASMDDDHLDDHLVGPRPKEPVNPTVAVQLRSSAILGVGFSAALACAGPEVLNLLFGHNYAVSGAAVVRLLAISVAIVGLTSPLLSLLFTVGAEKFAVRTAFGTLVLTGASISVLAPLFGAPGVAAGVVVGELLSAVLYIRFVGLSLLLPAPTELIILGAGAVLSLLTMAIFPPLSLVPLSIGALIGALGVVATLRVNYGKRTQMAGDPQ